MSFRHFAVIKGQSITEFLVALAFLAPIVLALPTLANMLSMQTEAYKAGRYVAWERTAYSGANVKTTVQLSQEINDRFMVNSRQGFGNSAQTTSPAHWKDFKNKINMYDEARGVAMNMTQSSATNTQNNASSWLAGQGNPANAVQINTLQSAQVSIPLRTDISLLQNTKSVNAWVAEYTDSTPPTDPIRNSLGYYVASSSALIADGWAPSSEQMFTDRVAGITSASHGFLNFWENSTLTQGLGSVFREINDHLYVTSDPADSFNMVDSSQSTSLPDNLKQYP